MKNKLSILAVAVGMAVSGTAVAHGNHSGVNATVNATVNSQAYGKVGSHSVVNGVNQTSVHGAFAASHNSASVGASGRTDKGFGQETTVGGSVAETSGWTVTGAGGLGLGGSGSVASQVGEADIEKTFKGHKTEVEVGSRAMVGTFSSAANVNSGAALSGSNATAGNVSAGVATSGWLTSSATGGSVGADVSNTWGGVVGGNETVDAGGLITLENVATDVGSLQNGFYDVEANGRTKKGYAPR